jgi:hypothetical protein
LASWDGNPAVPPNFKETTMFAKKTILAAAALAALTAAGLASAQAQPIHRGPAYHRDVARHQVMRHDFRRPYVSHVRVIETLRLHRYVALGNPYFFHGRYVVRSHDRFGRTVLVELDPWTGRFLGVVRI